MSAPKRKRWVCSRCDRAGILAPGRMRANDVRRFCLPCSEAAGVLVERTCPALDRKRAERTQARLERDARKRETQRKRTRHLRVARAAITKACRLRAFQREGVTMRPELFRQLARLRQAPNLEGMAPTCFAVEGPVPRRVCTLPRGHRGPHRDGREAWEPVRYELTDAGQAARDATP